jgi:hypothetical protein
MQYKTIVLNLLEQRPAIYEQLRTTRTLLATLDHLAGALKAGHEACKSRIVQTRPDSDPSQIASEALEMALQELEGALPPASSAEQGDPLSLDEAMAFLRRRPSPPG